MQRAAVIGRVVLNELIGYVPARRIPTVAIARKSFAQQVASVAESLCG
jgi:hypothetical protein